MSWVQRQELIWRVSSFQGFEIECIDVVEGCVCDSPVLKSKVIPHRSKMIYYN